MLVNTIFIKEKEGQSYYDNRQPILYLALFMKNKRQI